MSQFQNTIVKNTWPNCLIIPSKNGTAENCVQLNMPSKTSIIFLLIVSWVVFMLVAYVIYYFLNKSKPTARYNYWIILLILILAGIIVSVLSKML